MPPSEDITSESDIESIINLRTAEPPSESDLESITEFREKNKASLRKPATRKFPCSIGDCKEIFRRQDQLDRHEFHHTGIKKHICSFDGCDKVYSIVTHLKRHIKFFHEKYRKNKTIKCPVDGCKKCFDSPHNLEKHMQQVHENRKEFKCKDCGERFSRKIHLKRHEIVAHTGDFPYSCDKCLKKFVQECNLRRHICKSYKCDICNEIFDKWTLLIAHKKQSNHKTMYKCQKCDKEFLRQSLLNIHEQIHKDNNEEKEVFTCTFEGCPKFYYHKKNLKSHMKVVHDGKTFKCDVEDCGKELSTKQKLELHKKTIHKGLKKGPKKTIKGKSRAKRKDAGIPKTNVVTLLAGIASDPKVEKVMREGQVEIIEDLESNLNTTEEAVCT